MRIAILPVYIDEFQENQVFLGCTSIAYLMSYLEQYFPDDLIFPVPNVEFLLRTRPDIVGISAPYSEKFDQVKQIASVIKKQFNVPIILGGQHITYLPRSLPPNIDIGVLGEGEMTFRDLITLYKSKEKFEEGELAKIPGIIYHTKLKQVITKAAKVIEDIDSIPLTHKFFDQIPGNWLATVFTGRGNRYQTMYMVDQKVPIRLHSAERVIQDIVDIITNFPEHSISKIIPIVDEFFLSEHERFLKIAEIIHETGLSKYTQFTVTARPDDLTDEIILALKFLIKSVFTLNLNFVSPFQKIQQEIGEPVVSLKKQKELLEKCYSCGFEVTTRFVLGAPSESKEVFAKSYWYIRKRYCDIYKKQVTIAPEPLVPYPGTPAWSKAIMKRLVSENMKDWSVLAQNKLRPETPILNMLHSRGEFIPIFEQFNFNKTNRISPLRSKEVLGLLSIHNLLEPIAKNPEIRDILQITDTAFLDLNTIFYQDQEYIKLDTLSPWKFNSQKVKLKTEQKYDCIVLYFTLDIIAYPDKVLEHCYQILDHYGKLVISFFNTNCIYFIMSMLGGFDFAETFEKFYRLNHYTLRSMTALLKKHKFLPQKYEPVLLSKGTPNYENMINTLRYTFKKTSIEDYNTFFYTYICTKK